MFVTCAQVKPLLQVTNTEEKINQKEAELKQVADRYDKRHVYFVPVLVFEVQSFLDWLEATAMFHDLQLADSLTFSSAQNMFSLTYVCTVTLQRPSCDSVTIDLISAF